MSAPKDFEEGGHFPHTTGGREQPMPEPPPLTPRQRRILYAAMLAILLLVPSIALIFQSGEKPFQDLEAGEVAAASVELTSPGASAELDGDAIADLVSVLQAVKLYGKVLNYQELSGTFVTFTFTLADGTEHTVSACAPYMVIDGTGYQTDVEPCQALSTIAEQVTAAA